MKELAKQKSAYNKQTVTHTYIKQKEDKTKLNSQSKNFLYQQSVVKGNFLVENIQSLPTSLAEVTHTAVGCLGSPHDICAPLSPLNTLLHYSSENKFQTENICCSVAHFQVVLTTPPPPNKWS
jgi:hypothetical protein